MKIKTEYNSYRCGDCGREIAIGEETYYLEEWDKGHGKQVALTKPMCIGCLEDWKQMFPEIF